MMNRFYIQGAVESRRINRVIEYRAASYLFWGNSKKFRLYAGDVVTSPEEAKRALPEFLFSPVRYYFVVDSEIDAAVWCPSTVYIVARVYDRKLFHPPCPKREREDAEHNDFVHIKYELNAAYAIPIAPPWCNGIPVYLSEGHALEYAKVINSFHAGHYAVVKCDASSPIPVIAQLGCDGFRASAIIPRRVVLSLIKGEEKREISWY